MKKSVVRCPFCDKKINGKNFQGFDYFCCECGYSFNCLEEEKINKTKTRISSEEFMSIVLNGINEIYELSDEQRAILISFYSRNIKCFYKEIALLQVESFYEILSKEKELKLLKDIL